MDKIKVLCVPSDRSGCGFYRSLRPHTMLDELYGDKFDVNIDYDPNWSDIESLKKYDIIHVHKGLADDMDSFNKAIDEYRSSGGIFILDLDDYWRLDRNHPHYAINERFGINDIIETNIRKADYVTTTTEIFADKIRKYNNNVKVFPNAINPKEEQFIPKKKKSKRFRIGFVMGSSHIRDMQMIKGMTNRLPKEVLNKIQIVLCGFDINGTIKEIMPDGQINSSPMDPKETVWSEYERIITDNYRIISDKYKEFLLKYDSSLVYDDEDNEPYARRWTKDINNYATHYNDIDVLFVPLEENEFNKYKSELKFVEGGFMDTPVVASNFGPYTIGTINLFEKGGAINNEGNCILIDKRKAHKDWSRTIEKLLNNKEYIGILKKNLKKYVSKYDLRTVTKERAEWYGEIVNNKQKREV